MSSNHIPRYFAATALLFGSALVLVTPPFQVTDEFWHFFRAYQVSTAQWTAQARAGTRGGMLPASLLSVTHPFANLPFHPQQKTSLKVIRAAGHIPLEPSALMFIYFPATANYSPLVYAPQALGIALARSAGAGPLALMYVGREVNLLACTLLGWLTLRLLPALKPAMMLLLLMPMSISLAASLSADAMTIAVCSLFVATAWRCASETGELKSRWKWLIALLAIAVTLCKFAYCPIVVAVFLIPQARFCSRSAYWRFVSATIIGCALAFAAWYWQTAGTSLVLRPDRPDVSASRQLAYVRTHPFDAGEAIARGLWNGRITIARSFVGTLGWLDCPISPVAVGLYLIVLFIACAPSKEDAPSPDLWRLGLLAGGVLIVIGVFSVLNYVAWTPVADPVLQGIQGRYFIPVAPAIGLCIWGVWRKAPRFVGSRLDHHFATPMLIFCFCGCTYTVIVVVLRYFVRG